MNQNKVAIVTGATNGIGKQTALGLAKAGMSVVLVGRDEAKGQLVTDELTQASSNSRISFLKADLSSQASIRQLAQEIERRCKRIDVLVNNAGGFFTHYERTVDGLEKTFAFNHLNYFLLTNLLLDRIKKTGAGSRIVNVSSMAHSTGKIDFENLQGEKKYSGWAAYSNSKLMNILFTFALSRKLQGTGITANCLHPGFVATGFGSGQKSFAATLVKMMQVFAISPEQGAQTSLYLALSAEVEGKTGGYYDKSKWTKPLKIAYDENIQNRLWEVSQELTKG